MKRGQDDLVESGCERNSLVAAQAGSSAPSTLEAIPSSGLSRRENP